MENFRDLICFSWLRDETANRNLRSVSDTDQGCKLHPKIECDANAKNFLKSIANYHLRWDARKKNFDAFSQNAILARAQPFSKNLCSAMLKMPCSMLSMFPRHKLIFSLFSRWEYSWLGWPDLSWACLSWADLSLSELGWAKLSWTGLRPTTRVQLGLSSVGLGWADLSNNTVLIE